MPPLAPRVTSDPHRFALAQEFLSGLLSLETQLDLVFGQWA